MTSRPVSAAEYRVLLTETTDSIQYLLGQENWMHFRPSNEREKRHDEEVLEFMCTKAMFDRFEVVILLLSGMFQKKAGGIWHTKLPGRDIWVRLRFQDMNNC